MNRLEFKVCNVAWIKTLSSVEFVFEVNLTADGRIFTYRSRTSHCFCRGTRTRSPSSPPPSSFMSCGVFCVLAAPLVAPLLDACNFDIQMNGWYIVGKLRDESVRGAQWADRGAMLVSVSGDISLFTHTPRPQHTHTHRSDYATTRDRLRLHCGLWGSYRALGEPSVVLNFLRSRNKINI